MKRLQFDSILLLALVVPFIMGYSLSPGETSYLWFGLIFLGLFAYLGLDLLNLEKGIYFLLKKVLLWFLIFGVIGSAFYATIIVRQQTAPVYMIHDMPLQLESAIQFFLQGENPYAVTYFGTPLEEWHYGEGVNPALYNFVLMPFYLLFSLPFYFASISTIGFFDGRLPLIFLFGALLIMAAKLVKDPTQRLLFLTLLAFNPAMLPYTLEGRSDVFMFSFMFAGFYLLHKKRLALAGIPMALAFAVKQSAWPILPFFLVYLWYRTDGAHRLNKSLRVLKNLLPSFLTFAVIVLPFFFWDSKAFLEDTIFYLSGTAPYSYPISGYGFGMLLNQLGIIKDLNVYYPFIIWQVFIGLPALVILFRYLRKQPNVQRLIVCYGLFLFVFWYFSRYFNNNHLGYLSMVFITANFWVGDKK